MGTGSKPTERTNTVFIPVFIDLYFPQEHITVFSPERGYTALLLKLTNGSGFMVTRKEKRLMGFTRTNTWLRVP